MTTLLAIVEATAICAEIPRDVLISADRTRPIAWARQCGFAAARYVTDASFPNIGWAFGRRDHTTIIHGINAVQARANMHETQLISDIIDTANIIAGNAVFKSKRATVPFFKHRSENDLHG